MNVELLRKPLFQALLCAALALAAFLPILNAEFAWDDNIVQTMQLPFLTTAREAFKPPHGALEAAHVYYRPVVLLSYQLDEALTNAVYGPRVDDGTGLLDPRRGRIPHAATALYHALTAALVCLLARRALRGKAAEAGGLFAGLFFALNPVHIESVCTVAGRSDSLASLFLLAGLLTALAARDRRSLLLLALSAPLFLLAYLAKEVALVGVVLLALVLWLVPSEGPEEESPLSRWLPLLSPLAVLAAYALLRRWGGSLGGPPPVFAWGEALATLIKAKGFYLGKLLFPWPHRPYVPELPGWGATILSLFAGLVCGAGALYAKLKKRDGVYLLALLWAGVSLAPSLFLVFQNIAAAVVAERYLYLPSVGVALAAGALFGRAWETSARKPVLAGCALLLAAFGASCWAGTAIWRNDVALWTHITRDPATSGDPMPWGNLGTAYYVRQRLDLAEENYQKALAAPTPPKAEVLARTYNGLGNVRYARAQEAFFGRRDAAQGLALYREAAQYFALAARIGMPVWAYPKNLAQSRLSELLVEHSLTGVYRPELLDAAGQALDAAYRIHPGHPEILNLMDKLATYRQRAGQR